MRLEPQTWTTVVGLAVINELDLWPKQEIPDDYRASSNVYWCKFVPSSTVPSWLETRPSVHNHRLSTHHDQTTQQIAILARAWMRVAR